MDFLSIAESDAVLGDERSHAGDVVNRVLLEVSLIDSVEALDVGVSLVLERVPVKGRGGNIRESVLLGIMNGLSNRGWYQSGEKKSDMRENLSCC